MIHDSLPFQSTRTVNIGTKPEHQSQNSVASIFVPLRNAKDFRDRSAPTPPLRETDVGGLSFETAVTLALCSSDKFLFS